MAEPYVGEIQMFAGNYAPQGWAMCNGQVIPISGNEALFSLIGTTYGGDGQTTFALPDLRGRVALHTGSGYPLGQVAGSETVTLTLNQMPAHTHVVQVATVDGDQADPTGNVWASTSVNPFVSDPAGAVNMSAQAISAAGSGLPHENMMPFLVINYIIALEGIFPNFD